MIMPRDGCAESRCRRRLGVGCMRGDPKERFGAAIGAIPTPSPSRPEQGGSRVTKSGHETQSRAIGFVSS